MILWSMICRAVKWISNFQFLYFLNLTLVNQGKKDKDWTGTQIKSVFLTPQNPPKSKLYCKSILTVMNNNYYLQHTTLYTNSSWMDASTKSRPAAMQFSPLLNMQAIIP